MRRRRVSHRGFTLLELVLVLLIISTVLALAAASLKNWARGSRVRDTVDQFLATTRYARAQAVAEGRMYLLEINADGSYQLKAQLLARVVEGQSFETIADKTFGDKVYLPEGFGMQVKVTGLPGLNGIGFYPTGRADPAQVTITSSQTGETAHIVCASPAELFQVVTAQ
jgi:type II secretion system protein H